MSNVPQSQTKFIIGIATLLLLAFFIYEYNSNRLDWTINLKDNNEAPYGTLAAKRILENYNKQAFSTLNEKISKSLPAPDSSSQNENYVFIGEALLLDSNDVSRLLDFIETGNTAFISSVTIPDLLMDELYFPPCDTFYWEDYFSYFDTTLTTNFVHPDLREKEAFRFPYIRNYRIYDHYWQGFVDHVFCEESSYPTVIAQSPDSVIHFVMIPYGAGAFYLHSTPISFTNYFLTQEKGQLYAAKAFSHLNKDKIYWDAFSNVPAELARSRNWANNSPLVPKDGPLDYILSQPSLAWAWYLLLSLALLYILFRAKRRQRIIPVLAENKNTSLAFITTIGNLHFSKQNHRRIALQKMDLLLAFIRSKYKISMKDKAGINLNQLASSSEIEEAVLKKLFLIYTNIKSSTFVTDKTLIELHKLIHHFYKNCR